MSGRKHRRSGFGSRTLGGRRQSEEWRNLIRISQESLYRGRSMSNLTTSPHTERFRTPKRTHRHSRSSYRLEDLDPSSKNQRNRFGPSKTPSRARRVHYQPKSTLSAPRLHRNTKSRVPALSEDEVHVNSESDSETSSFRKAALSKSGPIQLPRRRTLPPNSFPSLNYLVDENKVIHINKHLSSLLENV